MSVQALSGQITSDFCEVIYLCKINNLSFTSVDDHHCALIISSYQGVRARLVDRDLAPKVNQHVILVNNDPLSSEIFLTVSFNLGERFLIYVKTCSGILQPWKK